jgi:hypothetical protein
MSVASRQRQLKNNRRLDFVYWTEPKRRFYVCLLFFMVFGMLEHVHWIFTLGAIGALVIHAAFALLEGNIYVRTISLWSRDAIYQRNEPAYRVALAFRILFLLLFVFAFLQEIYRP